MNARLFPTGLLLIAAIVTAACEGQYEDSDAAVTVPAFEPETVAVCPTFFARARQLDANKYTVLPTGSTAQSMQLLADGTAQFALAGRALKPQEPAVPHVLLGEGYSFLASQEMSIGETELRTRDFITDLDPALLREVFGIGDIQRVDNIYDSPEGRIAITDFKNTDYARAAPVHVLRPDGTRVPLSRTPVLYCSGDCPPALTASIQELLSVSPSSHESS